VTRAEPEHLSRNAVGAAPAPGHASGEEKAEKRSPFEGGWRVGSQGESGSDPLPGGGQKGVDSGRVRGEFGVGSGQSGHGLERVRGGFRALGSAGGSRCRT